MEEIQDIARSQIGNYPWWCLKTQQASTQLYFTRTFQEFVPGGAGQHNKLAQRLCFTREPQMQIFAPGGAGQHNKLAQRLYLAKEPQFKISSLVEFENTTGNTPPERV